LSIAWRKDVNDDLVREFVQTASILASFGSVPNILDSAAPLTPDSVPQLN
jgi:hypothetical protein